MREQSLPARYFAARRPLGDPLAGRGWCQVEILPPHAPPAPAAARLPGAVLRIVRRASAAPVRLSRERAS
ncbi:MAG TPA: hypothetical protein VIL85_22270 [Thermomicrobiales bacterium]|jgi:hypothetical protein